MSTVCIGGDAISIEPLILARQACRALLDKKSGNVVLLDVRGASGVTDYYVVASGASAPQLKAMFNEVLHALKEKGSLCYRRSGDPDSGWVVLDYVDVVIHILSSEAREYYSIEDLWPGAPRLG